MTENRLAAETSPYLLQHSDNPVHWQPWGPEAFAEAHRLNRPILLSVGYAACHWCHVMAHESFEDPDIAALMNDLFINIKVDREERPDLDHVYQAALSAMGQSGGWPLTMFLTPHCEPFWGGTYFPSTARYGRTSFPEIIRSIAALYESQPDKVTGNVALLRDALSRLSTTETGIALSLDRLDQTAEAALRIIDPLRGGTRGAPKFPQPNLLTFLWRGYHRTRSLPLRDAVVTTLDHICQGGIYDHLGGGFARYSTDDSWLVPHFEKMLYDNAQLVELLTSVWQETQSPLYAVRIAETIDWLLRDMRVFSHPSVDSDSFAFASAFDADSEGIEGKYYVWSSTEITAVLGPDASRFCAAYDVHPHGNWEASTILNRSHTPSLADPTTESFLTDCRARLLATRYQRIPPLRDDKVLADWNGLMIAALAFAGTVFQRDDWITVSRAAFDFITANLGIENGRLRHSWRAGTARHPGLLDDYANMARAALYLFDTTGETAYLDRAVAWTATVEADFADPAGEGYFMGPADADDLPTRPKTAADTATPAGNGTMIEVLARLYFATGDETHRLRAESLAVSLGGSTPDDHLSRTALCNAFDFLARSTQIIIAGKPSDPRTRKLLATAFRFAPPPRVFSRVSDGSPLPTSHPAHGKGPVNGTPAAYICTGTACEPPLTDPSALQTRLRSP